MDLNERVTSLEVNQKNIYHQIDEIKENVKDIHRLTASVERIALQVDTTAKKVDKIDDRLEAIEAEPGNNYKHYKRLVIGCVITGVVSAILGAVMVLIFK